MTRASQFDEISLAFGRIEEKLNAAVVDIAAVKTDVRMLRQAVDKDAADLAALKNKGAGILIGVAIVAGVIGAMAGAKIAVVIEALKGLFS